MNQDMHRKMGSSQGFIAALDQSGGSTPKALALYGIGDDRYSDDEEMFDRIHEMRTRIIVDPAFGGDRVLAAILFAGTMDREIDGVGTAEYLWAHKQIVPILKVDQGLEEQRDGAQVMKAMPGLDELLERALGNGVFGTKMRSVISAADPAGVAAVVEQQFAVGLQILDAGLVPILEPEVDITSPDKERIEDLLLASITEHLGSLGTDRQVMLKLSIPTVDDLYRPLIDDPRVLRVVALSGGYARDEANQRLSRNHGMIASFSRALTEGLSAQQSDDEFSAALDAAIASIFAASIT
jgi:fructose-bisphosphate aldolase class I